MGSETCVQAVHRLLETLAGRLTTIYDDECGHGWGGFVLTLTRVGASRSSVARAALRPVLDTALERLFGMARSPRFDRRREPPSAPAEARFTEPWRDLLSELVGPDGTAWLVDVGGTDDGFELHLESPEGEHWVVRVDQVHD